MLKIGAEVRSSAISDVVEIDLIGRAFIGTNALFAVPAYAGQSLVDLFIEATEVVMKTIPGYVSANIHRGLDGRHVASYAQWRSRDDFQAMLQNQEAGAHMGAVAKLATFEPSIYEVVYSDAAPEAEDT